MRAASASPTSARNVEPAPDECRAVTMVDSAQEYLASMTSIRVMRLIAVILVSLLSTRVALAAFPHGPLVLLPQITTR